MTMKNAFPIKNILNSLDLTSAKKAIAGMPAPPKESGASRTPGRTGSETGEVKVITTSIKLEHQFKSGANWFFWIAALSLVNSLTIRFGSSWNFVIGLGITQLIDMIAISVQGITSSTFHGIILFMDVCFAALFFVFGLMALKKSEDCFVMGMIFYGLDSLLFLLVFDVMGIAFHALALYFLYRGWAALKKLPESPAEVQQPSLAPPFEITRG